MVHARVRVHLLGISLLVLLSTMVAADSAVAQPGPAGPPARLFGSVTVSGQPAAPGTLILAFIGANICGSSTVAADSSYVLDVRSAAAQAGCGVESAIITFTVGGRRARETAVYQSGAFIERNLSAGAPEAHVSVARWARYADDVC